MFYRLPGFRYHKVSSLDEALVLLSKLDDVKILAGGTDLLVDMKTGRYKPRNIVDIGNVSELKYIRDIHNALYIGALTTIQEILDSPIVAEKTPLLNKAAREFGYWQVRNMATIGGNLCNASPAADMAPPLLVYEAILRIRSIHGERLVSIMDFFKGPRQVDLGKDEVLVEVIIPYGKLREYSQSYGKVGRRRGHDISIVAVAVALSLYENTVEDARVALNSVAPTPIRAVNVESYLRGRQPLVEVVEKASELVARDISPISDVRAPAEYRVYMAKLLTRELLLESIKTATRCRFE